MPDAPAPRSDFGSRFGLIAIELAIIGVLWYMGFVPHVIAAGLAVIIVVSGIVPERWGPLVTGVLMLVGAAAIYLTYGGSGDRRLAAAIAILGVLFTIYGVVRARVISPGA